MASRYAELLVDGIVGVGFRSIQFAVQATECGFAEFNGNQWNESWAWKRSRLEECDEQQLLSIYIEAKTGKDQE